VRALPSVASNSDFSSDSVAISGQVGPGERDGRRQPRPDSRRHHCLTRRRIPGQALPSAGGLFGGPGGGGGFGGGGFGGDVEVSVVVEVASRPWWRGGRWQLSRLQSRVNRMRSLRFGSNSALNCRTFCPAGPVANTARLGSNRFGLTFMSSPYIPHLTKPSGKRLRFPHLERHAPVKPRGFVCHCGPPTRSARGDFSAADCP